VLCTGMGASADHPDFSGSWILDNQRSSQDASEWAAMNVAQKGSWFRMAQTDKNGREIRSFEGECKTDGRFHPVQGGNGGSISCKWDGSTLITQEHWNNNASEREVRTTSSPDGKLIQDVHATGPEAKDVHLVWTRR